MLDAMTQYFVTSGFMPHGYCFLWTPPLLWLYVVSDSLIGLAYYSIPLALWYFVRKRQDLPFRWIFVMFGIFVLACGTTHFMAIWNIWQPVYWLDAGVKSATALASVATAALLWPLIPRALRIPSRGQLIAVNDRLQHEIAERGQAEQKLAEFNRELEKTIAERTATLTETNDRLRQAKQLYRYLFESNPMPMWIVDPDGMRLLEVNRAAVVTYGYARDELLAMSPFDLRPPADVDLHREQLKRRDPTGITFRRRDRHQKKDGSTMDVEVTVHPLEYAGRLTRLVLVNDVTDRVKAEEALEREHLLLRAVIDNLPDRIYARNTEGRIVLSNDANVRSRHPGGGGEAPGRTLSDIRSADLSAGLEVEDRAVMETGDPVLNREMHFDEADGSRRWFLASKLPLHDGRGKITGLVGILRDISEVRQSMEVIRGLNIELERRVLERTAQLEATNKELEAFAYSVSHDLRAPLRSIDGFSQALLEDYRSALDETGQDYLQRVRSASQRMGKLIDDLLALSRITSSEMRLEMVDLGALAREIYEELRGEQPKRVADVRIAGQLTAQGDPNLMRAALHNLLQNAWKFTGTKAHAVIEFGSEIRSGQRVFYVRDNGVGFDMAHARNLFGAFQRLHKHSEFPGTGVGLATVQRVVHRHGGEIWAEAEPGRGATFCFTLGFDQRRAAPDAPGDDGE